MLFLLALFGVSIAFLALNRPTTTHTATNPSHVTPKTPSKSMEQVLALADPKGSLPLDDLLRKRQRATKKNPEKLDLWILLGRTWVMKARTSGDAGFYLNAQACATIAQELEPNNPMALTLQGLSLVNQHEFSKARDLAQGVLQKHPQEMLALAILSDAQLELGRYKEALAAAQKMMDIKPSLPAYSRLSYLSWLVGRVKEAKDTMRKAIDAGRSSRDREPGTWAIIQAALYFWHEGDYNGALAGTTMALRYFPDYAPALVAHGRVLVALKRFEEARKAFQNAMQRSPQAQTAWLLGDTYTALQKPKEAKKSYQRAEKIGQQADHRTLALMLANQKRRLPEAIEWIKEEYTKRPDLYTADVYAWVLHRAGQHQRARKLIEQAMHLNTPDALFWYHAGLIYLACGETEKGRSFLLRAQKRHPHLDPTLTQETLAALAKLSPPASQPTRK